MNNNKNSNFNIPPSIILVLSISFLLLFLYLFLLPNGFSITDILAIDSSQKHLTNGNLVTTIGKATQNQKNHHDNTITISLLHVVMLAIKNKRSI